MIIRHKPVYGNKILPYIALCLLFFFYHILGEVDFLNRKNYIGFKTLNNRRMAISINRWEE